MAVFNFDSKRRRFNFDSKRHVFNFDSKRRTFDSSISLLSKIVSEHILTEDGDTLITEDGDTLVTEGLE